MTYITLMSQYIDANFLRICAEAQGNLFNSAKKTSKMTEMIKLKFSS